MMNAIETSLAQGFALNPDAKAPLVEPQRSTQGWKAGDKDDA